MKLEMLMVSMHRQDFNFLKQRNIECDLVLANQSDEFFYKEGKVNDYNVKMISTTTRGISRNRNIGLLHLTSDVFLLADDDILYENGYANIILQAFSELPDADAIIFNVNDQSSRGYRRMNSNVTKVKHWNALNYGSVRIAIKRESILKTNLWFNILFGAGGDYTSGEDSILLWNMLNNNMNMYTYPKVIATIPDSESTWFNGYNKDYYFNKGALMANLFPKLFQRPVCLFFSLKHRRQVNDINLKEMYQSMIAGVLHYNNR